jgi:hypothetical protein
VRLAQSVQQLIEIGLAMEAAGCIVLNKGCDFELIGVDQFVPNANLRSVGETAVTANAWSPSCSWAILRTTVLSIPPEKATRTDCRSEIIRRSVLSLTWRDSVNINAC